MLFRSMHKRERFMTDSSVVFRQIYGLGRFPKEGNDAFSQIRRPERSQMDSLALFNQMHEGNLSDYPRMSYSSNLLP